jgi:hypothetical protein
MIISNSKKIIFIEQRIGIKPYRILSDRLKIHHQELLSLQKNSAKQYG